MAEQTPAARAQPTVAFTRKMQDLDDLVQVATLTMQAVCTLDEIDDKFEDNPTLLPDVGISKNELEETLEFMRRLLNGAHTARDRAKLDLKTMSLEQLADDPTEPMSH